MSISRDFTTTIFSHLNFMGKYDYIGAMKMIFNRHRRFWISLVLLGAVLTVFFPAAPGEAMDKGKFKECITNELMQAGDHLTVGDLKKICREKNR